MTQDEPLNGKADGNTALDAKPGPASNQVYLRAERSGQGNGRVYRIAFSGSDGQGGTCSGVALVGVPHDKGKGKIPIDSGSSWSTSRPKGPPSDWARAPRGPIEPCQEEARGTDRCPQAWGTRFELRGAGEARRGTAPKAEVGWTSRPRAETGPRRRGPVQARLSLSYPVSV